MVGELLTGFALNMAAGIAIEVFKLSISPDIKQEIKKAFDDSLVRWSPNTEIRKLKVREFRKIISQMIINSDTTKSDDEFLLIFQEELCKHQSAFNYLNQINSSEQFEFIKNKIISIEDKITDFIDLIYRNPPNHNIQIEQEWKRQIKLCKESLENLKPNTALVILNYLEENIILNQGDVQAQTLAAIKYLKGQCRELIGDTKEAETIYIEAFQLDPKSVLIKEKACKAFYSNNMLGKVQLLIDEILQLDEFNHVAWLYKLLLSDKKDTRDLLSEVPPVILAKQDFIINFFYKFANSEFINIEESLKEYNLITNLNEVPLLKYSNINDAIFFVESNLQNFANDLYFDFNNGSYKDHELLNRIQVILDSFITQIKKTELYDRFKIVDFWYNYVLFLKDKDKAIAFELYKLFFQIVDKSKNQLEIAQFILMTANSLQLVKEEEKALEVIHYDESELTTQTLKSHILLKLSKYDKFIETQYLIYNNIINVDEFNADQLMNSFIQLENLNSFKGEEVYAIFSTKSYLHDSIKTLILSTIKIIQGNEVDIRELKNIESEIIGLSGNSRFFIGYIYFTLGKYTDTIQFYKKYLELPAISPSRDLHFLIQAIEKEGNNHAELLELLKNWRIRFPFDETFLRMEADICKRLPDWIRCLEICDYYLKVRQDEAFLVLKLICINELELEDKKISLEALSQIFSQHDFKNFEHLKIVNRILIENRHYQTALDIIYRRAINENDSLARTEYFITCINIPEGIIKEKDNVELGCYVKCLFNNSKVQFVQIKEDDKLSSSLLGHKLNDIVEIKRQYGNNIDTYQVLRIMDKYLSLHDQIYQEVEEKPHGNVPFQTVRFDDSSPETIIKTLIEYFGQDGSSLLKIKNEIIEQYYLNEKSFTEVILSVFSSDFINGYYNLINFQKGILIPPIWIFNNLITLKSKNLIVDISALLLLHEVSIKGNIQFDSKFYISYSTLSLIKMELNRLRNAKPDKLTISVTEQDVTSYTNSRDVTNDKIKFLESLINWIHLNCFISKSIHKFDILNKLKNDISLNPTAIMTIENLSLLEEIDDSVLLSDDSIYYKSMPPNLNRCFSSEYYLRSTLIKSSDYYNIYNELNYKGLSFSIDLIVEEFYKHIKQEQNYYNNCIANLNFKLSPTEENAKAILYLIKEIISIGHDVDNECCTLFKSVFEGIMDDRPYNIIANLIFSGIQEEYRSNLLSTLKSVYESITSSL